MQLTRVSAIALLGALGVPALAHAQARNVPIGTRTATMGGAGIAEGHDVAMPYLNPAGIAGVHRSALGLSGTAYAYDVLEIPSYNVPSSVPSQFGVYRGNIDEFESSQIVTIPSAVGYFKHVGGSENPNEAGHLVFGGAAIMPRYVNQAFKSRFLVDLPSLNGSADRNDTYVERSFDLMVGPVAGYAVTSSLRVGAGVYASYHSQLRQFTTSQTIQVNAGGGLIQSTDTSYQESTATDAVAILGAQLRIGDDLWLGFMVATPGLLLTGKETQVRSSVGFDAEGGSTGFVTSSRNRELTGGVKDPPRVGLGVAYVIPKTLSLAADGVLSIQMPEFEALDGTSENHFSQIGAATRTQNVGIARSLEAVTSVDFSVGAEYFLAQWLSMRAGYGETHDPRAEFPVATRETWMDSRRTFRTITLGFGFELGPVESTVGGALQLMTGKVDVPDYFQRDLTLEDTALPTRRTDMNGHALMLVVGGVISGEEAKEMVTDRAKQVDPKLPGVLP